MKLAVDDLHLTEIVAHHAYIGRTRPINALTSQVGTTLFVSDLAAVIGEVGTRSEAEFC